MRIDSQNGVEMRIGIIGEKGAATRSVTPTLPDGLPVPARGGEDSRGDGDGGRARARIPGDDGRLEGGVQVGRRRAVLDAPDGRDGAG